MQTPDSSGLVDVPCGRLRGNDVRDGRDDRVCRERGAIGFFDTDAILDQHYWDSLWNAEFRQREWRGREGFGGDDYVVEV